MDVSTIAVLLVACTVAYVLNTRNAATRAPAGACNMTILLLTGSDDDSRWTLAQETAAEADLIVLPPAKHFAGGCAGAFVKGASLAASSGASVAVACGYGAASQLRLLAGSSGAELLRLHGNGSR